MQLPYYLFSYVRFTPGVLQKCSTGICHVKNFLAILSRNFSLKKIPYAKISTIMYTLYCEKQPNFLSEYMNMKTVNFTQVNLFSYPKFAFVETNTSTPFHYQDSQDFIQIYEPLPEFLCANLTCPGIFVTSIPNGEICCRKIHP